MYRTLYHWSNPPPQKRRHLGTVLKSPASISLLGTRCLLKSIEGCLEPLLGPHGIPMGYSWLQEQPTKVKQRQHGHNNSCDKFCNNKTKKNFTRHRTRTIANSVAVRQCTGHSTTGPIRLPKKEGISEQFSSLLLRYHCLELGAY